MVGKARLSALLLFIIFLSPLVGATTVVYLPSDPGDIPLYKAVSNRTNIILSQRPSGDLIVAIDLNYEFLNKSMRNVPLLLLREAKKGKTVILGLNTLRCIEKESPETLKMLGISLNYTRRGIILIEPSDSLNFKEFGYDSDRYGLVIVRAKNSRVVLSSGGLPIVTEIPLGRGKLIAVGINPSAYYLDTHNPGVAEFLTVLIEHYSSGGHSKVIIVAGLFASAALIGYAATSGNPTVRGFRDAIKYLPFIVIGRFLTPPGDVLKNSTRRGIYEYVRAKSYATLTDITSTFGISRTTAKWHLRILTRSKLLEETQIGNTVVFYPFGKKDEAIRNFLLESETRRRIYELLKEKPLRISELSRILGLSKSTIHYNVALLEEYGLIQKSGEGMYEVKR
jgi:DNA-binding transcriptional ArsR family regulator